jgi:hypothetical protein
MTTEETKPDETLRPTPETIDHLAARWQQAKDELTATKAAFESIEQEGIDMVTRFGVVPPYAEKSIRLSGATAELTVTRADSITLDEPRVGDLRNALYANNREALFHTLFGMRTKYELLEGAAGAVKGAKLPKRLATRVMNMFARCFDVKSKKPSLKVVIADPAKPAKKQRGAKGVRP